MCWNFLIISWRGRGPRQHQIQILSSASDSAEAPNSNVKLGLAPVCKEEGVCRGGVNTSILFYSYGPYWASAPPWIKMLRNYMSIPRFPPFPASAPYFYSSHTVVLIGLLLPLGQSCCVILCRYLDFLPSLPLLHFSTVPVQYPYSYRTVPIQYPYSSRCEFTQFPYFIDY